MENSCYNCQDRFPGCHSDCERYKAWKEWLEEQKSLRYHAIKDPARKLLIDHQKERHEKWRKGTKSL